MITNVIQQSGHLQCPICKNAFDWSYRLNLMTSPEMDAINKALTETDPGHISHIATAQGKVWFIVPCQKCGCLIETDEMELVNSKPLASDS